MAQKRVGAQHGAHYLQSSRRSMLVSFLNSFGDISINTFIHAGKRRCLTAAPSQDGLALLASRYEAKGVEFSLPNVHLPGLHDVLFRFVLDSLLNEHHIRVSSFMIDHGVELMAAILSRSNFCTSGICNRVLVCRMPF